MAQCEVCGNDYDKAFEVTMAGRSHVFDSLECAIHALHRRRSTRRREADFRPGTGMSRRDDSRRGRVTDARAVASSGVQDRLPPPFRYSETAWPRPDDT